MSRRAAKTDHGFSLQHRQAVGFDGDDGRRFSASPVAADLCRVFLLRRISSNDFPLGLPVFRGDERFNGIAAQEFAGFIAVECLAARRAIGEIPLGICFPDPLKALGRKFMEAGDLAGQGLVGWGLGFHLFSGARR